MPRQDIILFRPKQLPNTGFSFNYLNDEGLPVITAHQTLDSRPRAVRAANYQVIANGQTICSGPMAEGPAGATPPRSRHWKATAAISALSSPSPAQTTRPRPASSMSISIRAATSAPSRAAIVGATVTLYKFDDATGQFVVV